MTWSENKWTALAALAAVLGVIVPVLLFFWGRDVKELTVKTVSRAVVVDLTEPALASLKLTYKNVAVTRLTAATIEVSNTGSRAIERADFEREVVIRFADSVPVLAARVAEQVPEALHPELNVGSSNVSFKPLLLNPGDRFRLTIHIRGDFVEPVVDARISGVAAVQRRVLSDLVSIQGAVSRLVVGLLALAGYFWLAAYCAPPFRKTRVALSPWEAVPIVLTLGLASGFLVGEGLRGLGLNLRPGLVAFVAGPAVGVPTFFFAVRRARRAAVRLQDQKEIQPPASEGRVG